MKLRLVLAAASCLVLPLAAHAQPVTGPYVAGGAGANFLNPVPYTWESFVNPHFGDGYTRNPGKWQMRPGIAGVGSIGYGFGNGFRVEVGGDFYRDTFHANDGSYQYNDVSEAARFSDRFRTTFHDRSYGGMNTYGPMVNAYYDFNVGLPIFPYVGAGVGYQWVKLNSDVKDYAEPADYGQVGGTHGSFAYELIAGVAYPLTMITPGLSLTAEYRFMQLTESRNYHGSYEYDNGKFSDSQGNVKIGQQSYNIVLLGFRYQIFNPPPPPPAPAPMPAAAPAPAPAKTYLVFFDWDKYNLTPRATQIIAQAAADSKTTQVTTIAVSGYTDTSGTPNYNLGLSVRRAKSVAAQLVADGVPASEIETNGFGETHLLVPTGPGVREPQNRRVEIVFN